MEFKQEFLESTQRLYICHAHVLNLCIVHTSKIPLVRNVMDTMKSVSLAFKYSAKHLLVFEEQLGSNFAVREEMGRKFFVKHAQVNA